MPQGVILLDRMLFSRPEWLHQAREGGFTRGAAWVDLLALANQQRTEAIIRGKPMPVERGECAYSKFGLAERWGRSQSWVSATLALWEKDGRIQIKKCDNETTVIFCVNFDAYQTGMLSAIVTESRAEREQNASTPGGLRDREGEGEGITTVPRGEGEGSGGAAQNFPEAVSDETMMAFCQRFPGEPSTGAPVMPEDWITDIIARLNGRRDLPRDWQRFIVAMWRREFRTWSGNKKNAATGNVPLRNGGQRQDGRTPAMARFEISKKLAAVRERLDACHETGAAPEPGDEREERELQKQLDALGVEVAA